jgi:putative ABC transport system substrate-binding protein
MLGGELTTTVPILTIWWQDPVLTGTVESMAHPGQNVTGTWIAGDDALVGKRLELLKEAVPGVVRVALFVNAAADSNDKALIDLATNAAQALGLTLTVIQVRDATGIEAASQPPLATARRRCSSVRARSSIRIAWSSLSGHRARGCQRSTAFASLPLPAA